MFRSRSHFRVPTVRVGPVIVGLIAALVVIGLVALVIVEPRPPVRQFEVPVTNAPPTR